ncbi:unnamed protein product, partial [Schistocephalus solidus]|uniref:Sema domain-containing protein n=1 Tax=Schistocephalus solidus TaxID=70667 RepID=A0A183TLQ7_SCHSO
NLTAVCIYKTSAGDRIPSIEDAGCPPANSGSSSELSRVLYVHPDRQQIFACSTSDFYGQATIMWFGSRIDADSVRPPVWHDLSNMTSIAELRRGGVNFASYIKTVSLRLPALGQPEALTTLQESGTAQLRLNALQCRGYATALASRSRPVESAIFDQVLLKPYGELNSVRCADGCSASGASLFLYAT